MRTLNAAGLALLHEFESWVGHAYPDPYSPLGQALQKAGFWHKYLRAPFPIPGPMRELSGKPWTIGYGFTAGVREGDTMVRAEGDVRLQAELRIYIDIVLVACTRVPNENELAAMVCLAWNIGVGWDPSRPKPKGAKDGFRQSSVLRAHNRGDVAAAARAFGLWNKAGGQVSAGLTRRRAAEGVLYLTELPQVVPPSPAAAAALPHLEQLEEASAVEPAPMPQVVDGESKFSQSPINRASIAAGGSAGVAAVAEVARTMADVKTSADSLGDWLLPLLLVAIVALCGYVVWQRIQQRKGGWA
jgi:lysozyme